MENPDQLRELFRMQRALNERIGVKTDGMSEEEKTKWLLNYTRAMQQEMAELTDSVPWKWWAKYQKFDEQNARVEVVDLFHFLLHGAGVVEQPLGFFLLAHAIGLDADAFVQRFLHAEQFPQLVWCFHAEKIRGARRGSKSKRVPCSVLTRDTLQNSRNTQHATRSAL